MDVYELPQECVLVEGKLVEHNLFSKQDVRHASSLGSHDDTECGL